MKEKEFWKKVESLNWKKGGVGDPEKFRQKLFYEWSREECSSILRISKNKREALCLVVDQPLHDGAKGLLENLPKKEARKIETYRDLYDTKPYLATSDALWDLQAHIIGLGQTEYELTLNQPWRLFERLRDGDYTENFEYLFPEEEWYMIRDGEDPVPEEIGKEIPENLFWNLIPQFGWAKKSDPRALREKAIFNLTYLMHAGTLGPWRNLKNIRATAPHFFDNLRSEYESWKKEDSPDTELIEDVIWHVIGRGRKDYKDCLKNPEILVKKRKNKSFKPGFFEAIPTPVGVTPEA